MVSWILHEAEAHIAPKKLVLICLYLKDAKILTIVRTAITVVVLAVLGQHLTNTSHRTEVIIVSTLGCAATR